MFLPEHLRCILRDKEQDREAQAMVQLVELLIPQILNDDSYITGTHDILHAARLLIQEVKRVNSKKYSNEWSIPKVYTTVQVFPHQLVQFFSEVFRD